MVVKITDQGIEFEFTVALKLNQGTIRKKRRILFPGSFFDTFLEKQKSIVKRAEVINQWLLLKISISQCIKDSIVLACKLPGFC